MLDECWSIWRDAPAMRVNATGCDKTYWHSCAQQSISGAAMLLHCGIAAGSF